MLGKDKDTALVYLINFPLIIGKKDITLKASMKEYKLHSGV